MKIRTATPNDADAVRRVHWSAFPDCERDLVSGLAVDLLYEKTAPPVLALVAEIDGLVTGHVAFSPVQASDTKEHLGYILAPLAVSPGYQKQGVASQLIETGIAQLSALGPGILLVYGDPMFYGRFGFAVDQAEHYTPPYQIQQIFGWQGIALRNYPSSPVPIGISCVSPLDNPALW